jgi:nucleoside-diphosphate-sugar epimerase
MLIDVVRVLIVGCGWLGRAIGRALVARGDRAVGVRRTEAAREELRRLGIEPLIADLASPGAAQDLPAGIDAVVACAAPSVSGCEGYRETYVVAVGAVLERYRGCGLRALVYTGSTGVFGRDDGSEVDERTPVDPATATGRILVEAERRVLDAAEQGDVPGRVVRLSGLYGPGRYGVINRVRSGQLALGAGEERWMNFCHREDAVRAVLASIDRGEPGAVYHASDAEPVRRGELVRWVAARLGIEPHTSGTPAQGANRRISAAWSRRVLGLELAYSTFRDGLGDVFQTPG